jgi:hypothetical protein
VSSREVLLVDLEALRPVALEGVELALDVRDQDLHVVEAAGLASRLTFTRAAAGVEQVDGLVGQLAAGDVAAESFTAATRRPRRG